MTKQKYQHPHGVAIEEPTHWLTVNYADDPEAGYKTAVYPDDLLGRFPVVQHFINSDPDFSLSFVIGLMAVDIKPTHWN